MKYPPRVRALCLLLVLGACCEAQAKSRYLLAEDPGSRHDFRYVMERESRLWVHLHCELRVPLARRLPDPLSSAETGDLMSTQYFTAISMTTGDFVPNDFRERDGYRVWLARSIARESDFRGTSSIGVKLSFPIGDTGPPPRDPMEIFELPAFETLTPYVWSPWRRADEARSDDFAGWEKLHGGAADAPRTISHPFELRCRTVLWDHLYTPIEAEDPNAGKPDPSAPASEEGRRQ